MVWSYGFLELVIETPTFLSPSGHFLPTTLKIVSKNCRKVRAFGCVAGFDSLICPKHFRRVNHVEVFNPNRYRFRTLCVL